MDSCPCGSDREFDACCGPVIRGARPAATAEELLRSRFSAYARKEVDHVHRTTHPEQRRKVTRESIRAWADGAVFKKLEILKTERGGVADQDGLVEFVALYDEGEREHRHHENAWFTRVDGAWYFDHRRTSGPQLERVGGGVGRNDPCPCGSGKKHKKCCGAA